MYDGSPSSSRYYVDPPSIVIRGKPSATMATKLEKDEKVRIEEQRKHLGPEGLAKAEKELQEAKKEHEKEIPPEILKGFPVPDVKSISWIPVQSLQEAGAGRKSRTDQTGNAALARHIESDGSQLPFFVQYDHVQVSNGKISQLFRLSNAFLEVGFRHNQRIPLS